jgi:hypothetical protein
MLLDVLLGVGTGMAGFSLGWLVRRDARPARGTDPVYCKFKRPGEWSCSNILDPTCVSGLCKKCCRERGCNCAVGSK